VMRLAYTRYAGERGFTPEQFRKTAEKIAGINLSEWFARAVSSTGELDYDEALEWYGLRFASRASQDASPNWKLEPRDETSDAQKSRLRALLAPAGDTSAQREPTAVKSSFRTTSRRSLSSVRVRSTPPRAFDVTSVLNETT
jgi:hypothetical protein